MSFFKRSIWLHIFIFLIFLIQAFFPVSVLAKTIFQLDDEIIHNADSLILDYDDSSTTEIKLQFGQSINAYLQYDVISDEFSINKNFNFNQFEAVNFVVEKGTSFPIAPVAGQLFFRTDLASQFVYDGTQWVGGISNSDTLDNLDSTQFLRSDVSDNYTGTGTLTFDSGTTLDIDGSTVYLDEIVNDSLTIDSDGSSANYIHLQFGSSLGEYMRYDIVSGEFDISSNLTVSGSLAVQNDIDVNLHELVEARIENLGAAPTCDSLTAGRVYYNTSNTYSYVCNGSTYVRIDDSGEGPSGTGVAIIDLIPEYAGATLQDDATDNLGDMNSGFDSSNFHNYYVWNSIRPTLQDYDIVLRKQLPSNFSSFVSTNPITFDYKTTTTGSGDNMLDVYVYDTSNSLAGLTNNLALTSSVADTWQTSNINVSSGTFVPEGIITIVIRMYSKSTNKAYAGELGIKYIYE